MKKLMPSRSLPGPHSRVSPNVLPQATRGLAALAEVPHHPYRNGHIHHPVAKVDPRREEFWRNVPTYEHVAAEDFLSYEWSTSNTVQGERGLYKFLKAVLPEDVPYDKKGLKTQSKQEFLEDVFKGIKAVSMAVRITPYILSRINWKYPRNDPILRQFVTLESAMIPDHPKLTLDSLHETADSPVPGLVHRYPDKALFLAVSVCPTYCTYCTRAYLVGPNTYGVTKSFLKGGRRRWDQVFDYIKATTQLRDIVISGGDCYYLLPEQIRMIGEQLISIPHIKRFRFASRGLAVAPARILDQSDAWASALADVAEKAKKAGKEVALHTHFNHPDEISWVTEDASQKLREANVIVRNQTVLLKGVNDDVKTMSTLIRKLADNHISPYYVYLCDMVKTTEHLRTPLQTMLDLESQIRGTIAGFDMPQFVVDLPGGGGKRLGCSHKSYDRKTGISRFVAPAVTRGSGSGNAKPEVFTYHDPVESAQKIEGAQEVD